jgi:hypothetical protein
MTRWSAPEDLWERIGANDAPLRQRSRSADPARSSPFTALLSAAWDRGGDRSQPDPHRIMRENDESLEGFQIGGLFAWTIQAPFGGPALRISALAGLFSADQRPPTTGIYKLQEKKL